MDNMNSNLGSLYKGLCHPLSSRQVLALSKCLALFTETEHGYDNEEMKSFSLKLLCTIATLTNDKDIHVPIKAFDTMITIQRMAPSKLIGVDLDPLFVAVYDKDEEKAAKAVEFLHEMLKGISSDSMQYVLNTVFFFEHCVKNIGEQWINYIVEVLVERLYPHCSQLLGDWAAWRRLLLGNSLAGMYKQQELACYLLLAVLDYLETCAGVETDYPCWSYARSILFNDAKEKKKAKNMDEHLKNGCLISLNQMASILGPDIVNLCEKFKNNNNCLKKMISIPRYFKENIDLLDMKGLCCYLISVNNTERVDEAAYESLACLHHQMTLSPIWRPFVPTFDRILFKSVPEFLKACICLTEQRLEARVKLRMLQLIKKVNKLAKFFDLTETSLMDDVFTAFRLEKCKGNIQVVMEITLTSIILMTWQLSKLVNHDMGEVQKRALLYKIQSQSRTLVMQLQAIMSSSNSLISERACSHICMLHYMLSPAVSHLRPYRWVYLPKPPLTTANQLVLYLTTGVSMENVPKDEDTFDKSCLVLQRFCLVLDVLALDIKYIASILIYCKFWYQRKNYNHILGPTLRYLASHASFPYALVESLVKIKENTKENLGEITKCLSYEILAKVTSCNSIAREIVGYGLSLVRNVHDLFIIDILLHFVHLVSRERAKKFHESVTTTYFSNYRGKRIMKIFIKTLEARVNEPVAEDRGMWGFPEIPIYLPGFQGIWNDWKLESDDEEDKPSTSAPTRLFDYVSGRWRRNWLLDE